jgi:hypothetical protein
MVRVLLRLMLFFDYSMQKKGSGVGSGSGWDDNGLEGLVTA